MLKEYLYNSFKELLKFAKFKQIIKTKQSTKKKIGRIISTY